MRHGAALGVAWVLALALGCATDDPSGAAIPRPELSRVEPAVARAVEAASAEVRSRPEAADAWGALGATLQAHDFEPEGEAAYREARRLDPEAFRWAYLLAVLRDDGDAGADEIAELYAAAARLRPDYAPLALRQGLGLSRRSALEAARAAFARAVDIDPELALAHRGLGQVAAGLGDDRAALAALERAAELAPEDGGVHAALAAVSERLGEPERARRAALRARWTKPLSGFRDPVFEEEVEARGVSSRHRFARAGRWLAEGRGEEALRELDEVRALRPEDPDVAFVIGVALARQGKREEALHELERAIALKPEHTQARLELGAVLEHLGRNDEALARLREAHELLPQDPALLDVLARALARRGDVDGMIREYEKLVALVPDDARVRVNLGTACARRADYRRAEAELRRAIEIEPEYAEAHHRLGAALEHLGREAEAQREFREAVRLDPASPAAGRLKSS